MSSVSMSGGCSAALFSGLQQSQATQNRSQQLFSKLDVNGDGAIDAGELKSFTDDISAKTGVSIDAGSLMQSLDTDGDGSISSSELSANGRALFQQLRQQLMSSQPQAGGQSPDAAQLFKQIDTNGDGSISADEFKAALQQGSGAAQPASHHHHGGMGHMLASLIDQYRASGTDDGDSSSAVSLAA